MNVYIYKCHCAQRLSRSANICNSPEEIWWFGAAAGYCCCCFFFAISLWFSLSEITSWYIWYEIVGLQPHTKTDPFEMIRKTRAIIIDNINVKTDNCTTSITIINSLALFSPTSSYIVYLIRSTEQSFSFMSLCKRKFQHKFSCKSEC